MTEETLDQKVLVKIDELLNSNASGILVVRKDEMAWTRSMVDGIVNYIKSKGYDAEVDEDNEEYHIVPIIKRS